MKIIERVNLVWGSIVLVMSAALGRYWYLFAAFAVLNIADYVTGIIKAKYYNKENSMKGADGIVRKLGCWVVIAIAFFLSRAFGTLGEEIGTDLGFTVFLGYFTLAAYVINEIRSILENLVAVGVELPSWLIRGLEVASGKLDGAK